MFFVDPESGRVRSMPRSWTSLAPPDPFHELANGRALLRLTDLQALVGLLQELNATLRVSPP